MSNNLVKQSKILMTDIRAGKNPAESCRAFGEVLATAYRRYGLQRLAMNTFSLLEMLSDAPEDKKEPYQEMKELLCAAFLDRAEDRKEKLAQKRDTLLKEMRELSRLTDAFGCYEYILNRLEPSATGTVEDVDPEEVADAAYRFAFADQDKVVVNTRIQSIVAELPVRMSKQRFFDILSNSLQLYKGGDLSVAEDFATAVREAFTDGTSDVFQEYPELLGTYKELERIIGQELNLENYETARGSLTAATMFLEDSVSRNMLLTEVLNDALLVVLTEPYSRKEWLSEQDKTAEDILKRSLEAEDIYITAEELDPLFLSLEGVQEERMDELTRISLNLEEWKPYAEEEKLSDMVSDLEKADLFTSTSLYMDTERDLTVVTEEAGEESISRIRDELTETLGKAMADMPKIMKRSCMARVLSLVPVFFNTRDEIREYFVSAISACKDPGELTAVKHIIDQMILEA